MRQIIYSLLLLLIVHSGYAQVDEFNTASNMFFESYVSTGKVDYKKVKENVTELSAVFDKASKVNVESLSDKEQMSFWINVYNLSVIKGVSDAWPINSPNDIPGFFDRIIHQKIGDQKLTLNKIENEKVRTFGDARIHFVLVCGAKGCPPIINKAYTANNLESLLAMQTSKALNDPNFIRYKSSENRVELSEIFKWYEKDFKKESPSVIAYINEFRSESNKLPFDVKVAYYSYDWTVNAVVSGPTFKSLIVDSDGSSSASSGSTSSSNLVDFTPSKLLGKGQFDIKWFNNLYTQTRSANGEREISKNNPRSNFFNSIVEFYAGVSKNKRINVGFIANVRSNNGNNQGPLSVFDFVIQDGIARAGLSSIAPSIKISPFKKVSGFSMQTSLFIPVFKDEAAGFYLDKRSYVFENRFFYDKVLGVGKFQLFTEIDFQYNFGEKSDFSNPLINNGERFANNSLGVPASVFLSYFPSLNFTVYGFVQHYQLIDLGNGFGQEFSQAGIGIKYQLTPALNLEASTSYFLRGTSTGLGETYNLGFRFVR